MLPKSRWSWSRISALLPSDPGQGEHALGLVAADLGRFHHFGLHVVGADFAELVEAAQQRHRLAGQAQLFEQAVEHQAVVDANLEALEAEGTHQVVDDQGHLDVGGVGGGADGVEVALPEFAVAAVRRAFRRARPGPCGSA